MKFEGLPLPLPDGVELPFYSMKDLLQLEVPPMQWLVQDLIPAETINLLVAPPGTGKSLVCLDLAMSVVTDRLFLGRGCRSGTVLYLAAEDGWKRVHWRASDWVKAHGATGEQLDRFRVMPFSLQVATGNDDSVEAARDAWEQLYRTVDFFDPILIILDPFVELHEGLDENDAAQMSGLIRNLRKLVRGKDRAMIITHHDRKSIGGEPGVYSGRGSSAIPGGVDGQYHLRAAEAAEDGDGEGKPAKRIVLHVTKGRDLPPEMMTKLGLRLVNMRWVIDSSAVGGAKVQSKRKALAEAHEALLEARRPLTVTEFATLSGEPRTSARRLLDELVAAKLALCDERRPAKYFAVPTNPVA